MHHSILLHTNDIHGRIDGLTHAGTLVEAMRDANPSGAVLFVDAGDSEEDSERLSNLTKGAAMHRLLSAAGCAAAAVGNAALMRYGPTSLASHAQAATYPLLLANVSMADGQFIPGTHSRALLPVWPHRLGVIGVTAPLRRTYEQLFALRVHPRECRVHECRVHTRLCCSPTWHRR